MTSGAVALLISAGVGLALLLFLGVEILWLYRFRRVYRFRVGAHEAVVKISAQSAELLVDELVQDEFSARNMRTVMLRAIVDGEEFRARIEWRGFKTRVGATYLGKEVVCIEEAKG